MTSIGSTAALAPAEIARLQQAGVGDETLALLGNVRNRMAGSPDAAPDQDPGQPVPEGPRPVDTPDRDYPQLAASHVAFLRHVGVREIDIAHTASTSPNPVAIDDYIRQIIAQPDEFDQAYAAHSGEPRPVGTTRQLIATLPPELLPQDPAPIPTENPTLDTPHREFRKLSTAQVQLMAILGYDEAGMRVVDNGPATPAEIEGWLQNAVTYPEEFDRHQGWRPGTTRARLVEAGILPPEGGPDGVPGPQSGGGVADWIKPAVAVAGLGVGALVLRKFKPGAFGRLAARGANEPGLANAIRGRGMFARVQPASRAAAEVVGGGAVDDAGRGASPFLRAMRETTEHGTPPEHLGAMYSRARTLSGGAVERGVPPEAIGGTMPEAVAESVRRAVGIDGRSGLRRFRIPRGHGVADAGDSPQVRNATMAASASHAGGYVPGEIPPIFSSTGINLASVDDVAEVTGLSAARVLEIAAQAAGGAGRP